MLKNVNPVTCDGWNAWVKAEDTYGAFLSAEWAQVLEESYDYRAHYLILRKDNRFSALLPFMEIDSALTGRRGVSLPFSDHCDPVVGGDVRPSDVLAEAIEYAESRGWRYLDFHGGRNLLPDAPVSSEYVGHRLDLSEDWTLESARFSESKRRSIRKAARSGTKIEIGSTREALDEFYRLHCLTRKRHRLPAQPSRFFQTIYDRILSNDLGHIVRAVYEGKTVGAAIFFHLGDRVLYKFAASDLRYRHLRANDLILWKDIEWSAANGYKTFDFGRTDIRNTGLRHFKSGWSTEEYPIMYYKYDVKEQVFITNTSGWMTAVMKPTFRMMPIPISRIIGAMLYRHLG